MANLTKLMTCPQLRQHLHDGMSIMFGGFMGVGTPMRIVHAILDSGIKNLVIIGNDTAFVDVGIGVLVANQRVQHVIASHIGTNPETGRQMIAGSLQVTLIPQGTLAERIRAAGAGLGGILTSTGVGTVVEEGKMKLNFEGIDYLVERPLRADMAILKAHCADEFGNLTYLRAGRNFNPLMAMAADFVVAEYDELLPVGGLDPEHVITPGVLVQALISAHEA